MVRRAILDRDELPADEDQILPDDLPAADPEPQRPPRRGAGGRWLIWLGRAIVWAVLLLVGYRGAASIVQGETTGSTAGPAAPATAKTSTTFPVSLAEAFAQQFGTVYLNFSPATAAQRARELSQFLPPGDTDPQLGWDGAGTERLQSEPQVAGVSVTGAHTAVVKLLATVNGGQLIELGVPVYVSGGAISLSGAPALLHAPGKAAPPASTPSPDQATQAALQRQLPAFFQAYASGDPTTLARFVAPGAHIRGLGGTVTFGGIVAVFAPPGGTTRTVTATVTWRLPAAKGRPGKVSAAPPSLQMSYQLTVVRQGGSWDIRAIGALDHPQSPGPP